MSIYPKYTVSQQKGSMGAQIVSKLIANEFRWLVKPNHQETDFGIDGQIELVDDDNNVTGQALAFQVKCGESFIQKKNKWGYEYTGEEKHLNYLSNYPLLIIIIICNPESEECHFEFFDEKAVQLTNAGGWKLTIPFENVLSNSKKHIANALPPAKNYWPELRGYWRMHKIIMDSEIIIVGISAKHIQNGDTQLAEAFFQSLQRNREIAEHSRNRVELVFNGYDDDVRELYAIEEVKQYLKQLALKIDTLLFFFSKEPRTSLRVVSACCSDATDTGRRTSSGEIMITSDIAALVQFMKLQKNGFDQICNWLKIPKIDSEKAFLNAARLISVDENFLDKFRENN